MVEANPALVHQPRRPANRALRAHGASRDARRSRRVPSRGPAGVSGPVLRRCRCRRRRSPGDRKAFFPSSTPLATTSIGGPSLKTSPPIPRRASSLIDDTSDDIHFELTVALNAGAIIHMPAGDDEAEPMADLRGRRFRLSYLLAPGYRIALTTGRAVKLSTILAEERPRPRLAGPARAGARGVASTPTQRPSVRPFAARDLTGARPRCAMTRSSGPSATSNARSVSRSSSPACAEPGWAGFPRSRGVGPPPTGGRRGRGIRDPDP